MSQIKFTEIEKSTKEEVNPVDLTNPYSQYLSAVSSINDDVDKNFTHSQLEAYDLKSPTEEESIYGVEEFKRRGFISSESWSRTESFHSRIIEIDAETITCECVVDKENQEFELRVFNKVLFGHLTSLSVGQPILIVVKEKNGSSRIDIYNGKNLVDESLFDLQDLYEGWEDSELNKPFKL